MGIKRPADGESRANGYFIAGNTPLRDSLPAGGRANQDQVRGAMERAVRKWLDRHGLPAIMAAVLGVIVFLAVLFVAGGYWYVTP